MGSLYFSLFHYFSLFQWPLQPIHNILLEIQKFVHKVLSNLELISNAALELLKCPWKMWSIQPHTVWCSVSIKYCPLLRLNIPFKFCFVCFGILCHLYPLAEHLTHRYFITFFITRCLGLAQTDAEALAALKYCILTDESALWYFTEWWERDCHWDDSAPFLCLIKISFSSWPIHCFVHKQFLSTKVDFIVLN